MSSDSGRYLVSMDGVTHELFGGDPEEIILRVSRVGEGARTLAELAGGLQEEADRYDRLERGGWHLQAPFREGEGRCRKATSPGAGSGTPPAEGEPPGPPASTLEPLGEVPSRLQQVVDGVASLPAAADALRAAAQVYARLQDEGRRLADAVVDGVVRVR